MKTREYFRIGTSLVAVIIMGSSSVVRAAESHTVGATYAIAERDSLEEVEERAARVDWDKVIGEKKEKMIEGYKPKNLSPLPKAEKNRTFRVDMTYTLPFDIPDGKGNIIYPKGYTYNPLQYSFYPRVLVFIDGTDRKHVEWFKSTPYFKDINTKVIITDGSYFDLQTELGRPIYYAPPSMVSRLQLRAVPSVVMQKGPFMEVSEYHVD